MKLVVLILKVNPSENDDWPFKENSLFVWVNKSEAKEVSELSVDDLEKTDVLFVHGMKLSVSTEDEIVSFFNLLGTVSQSRKIIGRIHPGGSWTLYNVRKKFLSFLSKKKIIEGIFDQVFTGTYHGSDLREKDSPMSKYIKFAKELVVKDE